MYGSVGSLKREGSAPICPWVGVRRSLRLILHLLHFYRGHRETGVGRGVVVFPVFSHCGDCLSGSEDVDLVDDTRLSHKI